MRVVGVALSLNLGQKVLLVLDEEGVSEDLPVRLLDLELMEVIHVKLPDEGRKVAVFPVLGQDIVAQKILIFNLEPIATISPRNYFIGHDTVHNFVQFNQE